DFGTVFRCRRGIVQFDLADRRGRGFFVIEHTYAFLSHAQDPRRHPWSGRADPAIPAVLSPRVRCTAPARDSGKMPGFDWAVRKNAWLAVPATRAAAGSAGAPAGSGKWR